MDEKEVQNNESWARKEKISAGHINLLRLHRLISIAKNGTDNFIKLRYFHEKFIQLTKRYGRSKYIAPEKTVFQIKLCAHHGQL